MTAKAKKVWKTLTPILIISTLFGLLCLFVWGTSEHYKGMRTPLGWCIWEIHTHEDYDCEWTYIYQEVEPKSEIKKEADKGMNVYCYYITTFNDDRIGEWYCFIECYHKDFFDQMINTQYYAANEVYMIDCDLAREDVFDERIY